jgi:hypothetical protein
MITKNRCVSAHGYEMRTSRHKKGFENSKIVLVELNNIERIVDMSNPEAKEVIGATNHLSIFKDNVDHTGFKDTQMLIEHMVELTGNCADKSGALLFYERNLIKSLMRDVFRRWPSVISVKDKENHQSYAKEYERLSKFEGTVRFCLDTDDPTVLPSDLDLQALLNNDADEHYSLEFAEFLPRLSPLAVWFTHGDTSIAQAVLPPKRKKTSRKLKEVAATKTEAKVTKKSKLSERVEKIWHVGGKPTTRWVRGDWTKMDDEEKMEYRTQRDRRGNWPAEVPQCEQWIRREGQIFRTCLEQ